MGIVLHLEKRIWDSNARPFRCEEFWFHILGFSDIVKEAWSFHFAGSNAFWLLKKIQCFR